MTREELIKRSEIQFQLINLNIVTAGALAALAYSEKGTPEVILIIPFISFALCAYWVHLGITIRLNDTDPRTKFNYVWQSISWVTHATSVLFTFVGIPLLVLLIYPAIKVKDIALESNIISGGFALCGVSVILYFTWFYLQYFQNLDSIKK